MERIGKTNIYVPCRFKVKELGVFVVGEEERRTRGEGGVTRYYAVFRL